MVWENNNRRLVVCSNCKKVVEGAYHRHTYIYGNEISYIDHPAMIMYVEDIDSVVLYNMVNNWRFWL